MKTLVGRMDEVAFRGETSSMRFEDSVVQTSMTRHCWTLNYFIPNLHLLRSYKGVLSLCCKRAAAVINLLYLEMVSQAVPNARGGADLNTFTAGERGRGACASSFPYEREAAAIIHVSSR